MGRGSANAWLEAGNQIMGVGGRIADGRRQRAEDERLRLDDERRAVAVQEAAARQRMMDDISLAELGGGRGPTPTMPTEIMGSAPLRTFEPPPFLPAPRAMGVRAPDLAAVPAGSPRDIGIMPGATGGIGARLTPAPAPASLDLPRRDGPVSYDAAVGRFARVGDDAYITRPDVMEMDRENRAAERASTDADAESRRRSEEAKARVGIGAKFFQTFRDPNATREERAAAEAGLLDPEGYNLDYTDLHPRPVAGGGADTPTGVTPTAEFNAQHDRAMAAATALAREAGDWGPDSPEYRARRDVILRTYKFATEEAVGMALAGGGTPAPSAFMNGAGTVSRPAPVGGVGARVAPAGGPVAPAGPATLAPDQVSAIRNVMSGVPREEWDAELRAEGYTPEEIRAIIGGG